jgi:hypothetical protein
LVPKNTLREGENGAEGSRTPDLNNANVAFYQLNYGPEKKDPWYFFRTFPAPYHWQVFEVRGVRRIPDFLVLTRSDMAAF